MIAVPFKESNAVLGAPPGMEDEVYAAEAYFDGKQYITKWKGTWRDRLRFLLTGRMWIGVMGQGMPPLWLDSATPFVQPEKK